MTDDDNAAAAVAAAAAADEDTSVDGGRLARADDDRDRFADDRDQTSQAHEEAAPSIA